MPYVYRVQNEKGRGPYAEFMLAPDRYGSGKAVWLSGVKRSLHPTPEHENLDRTDAHRCGFSSLTQLQAWFRADELRRLAQFGFRPVRVKASSVLVGKRQVIFIPEAACDSSESGVDK